MSSLERSKSKAGPGGLGRTASRLVRDGDGRRKKDYSDVQQGLKQLYPPEDRSDQHKADMDIVLVPGLGANPEESWKSSKGFNWTTSEDALIKDFPNARVLLFMYESAWFGALKVRSQVMSNIAKTLLVTLQSKRKHCQGRPIILIGHSMGGLVVANAVAYAEEQRKSYPLLFEAVTATFFFGTPFRGTDAADMAAMFAGVAEKVDKAAASKLLDMMKNDDNEALRLLREKFAQVAVKLNEPIKVVCFWEQRSTDFGAMPYIPSFMGLTNHLVRPNKSGVVVSQASASLDSFESYGLACNHRDLVKYDGPRDRTWSQTVREKLKENMVNAELVAKNRVNFARGLDYTAWRKITEALGSPQIEKRRGQMKTNAVSSPWVTKTNEFEQWFRMKRLRPNSEHVPAQPLAGPAAQAHDASFLWIRGREGRGKTGAVLSVIDAIEKVTNKGDDDNEHSNDQDVGGSDEEVLLAYFFCEDVADSSTAEDLLKSVIIQLVQQQNMLAAHAKGFIKKKVREGSYKSTTQPTVENLWQCLQDMLHDNFVGRRVYLVLHNLHVLAQDADSAKLLSYLAGEVRESRRFTLPNQTGKVETRWLVTSRNTHSISRLLEAPGICLVDLEDEKYGDQVQRALQRHAKERVAVLEGDKKYSKALSFYATSLLGRRAQNVHWIDITCVQLEQLPETESHMAVRRVLERTPQDLDTLLRGAWDRILTSAERRGEENSNSEEGIREILRVLILTFEDPTLAQLGVLAGFSETDEQKKELQTLVDMCQPFLVSDSTAGGTVEFMNPVVKTHLQENAQEILGLSVEGTKWQHGVLALRSLDYIKTVFGGPESEVVSDGEEEEEGTEDNGSIQASLDDDNNQESKSDSESDSESESESESEEETDDDSMFGSDVWDDQDEDEGDPSDYAVQFWLRHAGEATADFATELALETELWASNSSLRRRWLTSYATLTGDFLTEEAKRLKALHVAASLGFRLLVMALVENGHGHEMKEYDYLGNTPLHLAASFGRSDIVDELLNRGADINAVESESDDTALHLAAGEGHVDVVKTLIRRGADCNMYSTYSGLIINAAISSGRFDVVELLVQAKVSLFPDRADVESPLAQAAAMSDPAMLRYLMDKYARFIRPAEYGKAVVSAAGAGRLDVFKSLLPLIGRDDGHGTQDACYQKALDEAARESRWDVVTFILECRRGLSCDEPFYQAATGVEDKDDVLEALWEYTGGRIAERRLDDALYDATDREKLSTVRLLLQKFNADPDAKGDEYGDALTAAAHDGRLDILEALLAAGANVHAPEGYALQIAAAKGHEHIVTALLQHGAKVNARTVNAHFSQGTALQGDVESGMTVIAKRLLAAGANPNLGAGENAPPIFGAAVNGNKDMIALLIDARADVNVVGGGQEHRSTPLIETVNNVWGTESLKKLLDAGADIEGKDKDGETALIAAARTNDEDAIGYLLRRGADVLYTAPSGVNALQAGLESDDAECMEILVHHVSCILRAVRQSMMAGNADLTLAIYCAVKDWVASSNDEHATTEEGQDVAQRAQQHGLSEVNGQSLPQPMAVAIPPPLPVIQQRLVAANPPPLQTRSSSSPLLNSNHGHVQSTSNQGVVTVSDGRIQHAHHQKSLPSIPAALVPGYSSRQHQGLSTRDAPPATETAPVPRRPYYHGHEPSVAHPNFGMAPQSGRPSVHDNSRSAFSSSQPPSLRPQPIPPSSHPQQRTRPVDPAHARSYRAPPPVQPPTYQANFARGAPHATQSTLTTSSENRLQPTAGETQGWMSRFGK